MTTNWVLINYTRCNSNIPGGILLVGKAQPRIYNGTDAVHDILTRFVVDPEAELSL